MERFGDDMRPLFFDPSEVQSQPNEEIVTRLDIQMKKGNRLRF